MFRPAIAFYPGVMTAVFLRASSWLRRYRMRLIFAATLIGLLSGLIFGLVAGTRRRTPLPIVTPRRRAATLSSASFNLAGLHSLKR